MEQEKTNVGDMNKVYEISYLLLPSLAEEQVPATVSELIGSVTAAGGTVISSEDPVLIDLAYPMVKVIGASREKCSTGYFGWVKFEIDSDGRTAVEKVFATHAKILRYLLVKTVKENTLLTGKMMLRKEDVKKDSEGEDGVEELKEERPSTPEDIDKSIDSLVIA